MVLGNPGSNIRTDNAHTSANLIINSPTQKPNIPLTFCFIYVILIVCYVLVERKPITVATKNVTLFANLFFFKNGSRHKNVSEPL